MLQAVAIAQPAPLLLWIVRAVPPRVLGCFASEARLAGITVERGIASPRDRSRGCSPSKSKNAKKQKPEKQKPKLEKQKPG